MTLVGYGLDINEDIVESSIQHEKKQLKRSFLFAATLGLLLTCGLSVGKFFIDDLESMPLVGALASGTAMFVLMTLIGTRGYFKAMVAYEGDVYKVKEKRRKVEKNMDSDRYDTQFYYYIYIQKSRGGKKKHLIYESNKPSIKGQKLLKYYEGARVKKFRAVTYPEKYDKRKDEASLCLMCGAIGEKHVNFCKQCGTEIF